MPQACLEVVHTKVQIQVGMTLLGMIEWGSVRALERAIACAAAFTLLEEASASADA